MCGIVGYLGDQEATEVIFEGLKRLEYRGYDSAGIATVHEGKLTLKREVGKLRNLEKELLTSPPPGHIGIGHTRWATHGRPTPFNAHPHTDCSEDLVVVHNGIIENFLALKAELAREGHAFRSDTDTEVLAHLVEAHYKGDLVEAVRAAMARVTGTYACAILHRNDPERIVGIKMGNPLVVGVGDGENFLASDVTAILNHTRRILYLEDGDLVVLTRKKVQVFDADLAPQAREIQAIDWNIVAAEKAGFEHFMLKEIHEQPATLTQTLGGRVDEDEGALFLDETGFDAAKWRSFERIAIVACGTAYYAGLVGKYLIEDLARVPVEVDLASEYRYRHPVVNDRTLFIAVSQSGETMDTLAALKEAKRCGAASLGIINVKGSAIAREVEGNLYIHAGPEIGVASTKAYTAMVAALTLVAMHLGRVRGHLDADETRAMIGELRRVPALVGRVLEVSEDIQLLASGFTGCKDFLFLGRGPNYPTALEGALKLKEISYIHAEAYAAGEMKHGPIALIDEELPTIAVATQGATYEKVLGNIQEVKARGGTVIAVATEGDLGILEYADRVMYVPAVSERLSPLVNVVPLQLLAYHIARLRGCDVDQPRNLAKSVTVE